ncbi:MAG: 2,3-bisphosphoglycerate-independent phosphoglycerate mutase [ANME-2 cluster archaeon]|nr:2,3-bisphosphoglycerate-independent phosphoglycerate mutase [ANME-2 cluster archaeon]
MILRSGIYRYGLCVFFVFLVSFSIPLTEARTIIDVGETNPPQNIVLLIVDGMGSAYVTPGSTPLALNGDPVDIADVPFFKNMISDGILLPHIIVPTPGTVPAHSVIITGFSRAEQEMVDQDNATIYDVLKDEGFLCIAIMHKGDFSGMRNEQDIILYKPSDSISNLSFLLQVNDAGVPEDIIRELDLWEQELPEYLEGTDGLDSYIAYSDWELDASRDIVSLMARQHPYMKYILTINVGVVDCAGHYRGVDGYIGSIEGVDSKLEPLYSAARDSNTALIITADHGMAFKTPESSRGGHASEDYHSSEAVTVPLLIISPNVAPGIDQGGYAQEDLAPTLLSILDIPSQLKYSDGEVIPIKDYANLLVSVNSESDVEVIRGSEMVSGGSGDILYFFTGLRPKINYTVRVNGGKDTLEQSVHLNVDRLVRFETVVSNDDRIMWNGWTLRRYVASVLTFIVIVGGLLLISRIRD